MVTLDQVQTSLIVEDDFIIAMEMAERLERLGCRDVQTASKVESALEAVRKGVQFAVLKSPSVANLAHASQRCSQRWVFRLSILLAIRRTLSPTCPTPPGWPSLPMRST